VASFLSVWYVVCFTVERYLMIRFPLKRQEICRPGRAKAVVGSLAGVALVLYNFAIWTSGVAPIAELPLDKPFCQVRARSSFIVMPSSHRPTTTSVVSRRIGDSVREC